MTNLSKARGGFPPKPFLLKNPHIEKKWYILKGIYRSLRVKKLPTCFLGPQYKRSKDCIEIDITYRCNLRCLNCNRSINKAPENLDIKLSLLNKFISDSRKYNYRWKRIRLLGGEPTLHPEFLTIIQRLRESRYEIGNGSIEVVTNGYGNHVNNILKELPSDIYIENSRKDPNVPLKFRPFSWAPQDFEQHPKTSYINGCQIIEACGMGLTPLGYYPCAIAGGIDRVVKKQRGRQSLPPKTDNMKDILDWACRLCGRFIDGHHIPPELLKPTNKEFISPSWTNLYKNWQPTKKS